MTPEQLQDLFMNKPYSRLLVLIVVGALIACGVLIGDRLQQDKDLAGRVESWRGKYAYLIDNLTKDFKKAQTDSQSGDTTALAQDCVNIKADAMDAQSKPAIPDKAIQPNWAAAMRYEVKASTECIDGEGTSDQNKIAIASSDFNNATKDLSAVSKQLAVVKN